MSMFCEMFAICDRWEYIDTLKVTISIHNSCIFVILNLAIVESSITTDDDSDSEPLGSMPTKATRLSKTTIAKWYSFFRYYLLCSSLNCNEIYILRDIIGDYMVSELCGGHQIGGRGLHVEIDESLFGKLKVNEMNSCKFVIFAL